MTETAIRREGAQKMGFFTDTTVCIGCKACEVACKQWNDLPASGGTLSAGRSYDATGSLGGDTWRHVRFVELSGPTEALKAEARAALARGAGGHVPGGLPAVTVSEPPDAQFRSEFRTVDAGALADAGSGVSEEELPDLVAWANERTESGSAGARKGAALAESSSSGTAAPSGVGEASVVDVAAAVAAFDSWVFMSDVCKHCTRAGCLDACPTGALVRTEYDTVVLQPDVCNGCGYCVPACPFGVVDRVKEDGRAAKCTLCYDRLEDGLEPACAKACPTDSIQFGPYEEIVAVARDRVSTLHGRGLPGAYLYGAGDEDGDELAGGLGAFFLLTEPPERYGLPAQADSPIQENVVPATLAAMGAGLLAAVGVAAAFVAGRKERQRW